MKRTLIAAAIAALATGSALAQSSYSIYGLIDLSYGKSVADDSLGLDADFHSGGDNGSGEGNSTTRIGIKGSADVAPGIKANFNFETGGITSDGDVNPGGFFFNRQAWAGLSSSYGEVRLGRQDNVPFQTGLDFDFNGASNGQSAWGYSGVAPWGAPLSRQSRSLQYISPVIAGFKAQGGFVPKGNDATAKDTFSGGVTFATGGLKLAATFETPRVDNGATFGALMGMYDFGVVKVSASYADGATGIKGYGLGIVAPVAGFNIGALYGDNSDTKGKAYEIFINKEVFKNTYAYAEFASADDKAMQALGLTSKGNGFAVGMIFVF